MNLAFTTQSNALEPLNSGQIKLNPDVLTSLEQKLPYNLQRALEHHALPPLIKVRIHDLMTKPSKKNNSQNTSQQAQIPNSPAERVAMIKTFTNRYTYFTPSQRLTESEKNTLSTLLVPATYQPDSYKDSMLYNLLVNIQNLAMIKKFLDESSFNPSDEKNIAKHNQVVEQVAINYQTLNEKIRFIDSNMNEEQKDKESKTFTEIHYAIILIQDLIKMMYLQVGEEGEWNPDAVEKSLLPNQGPFALTTALSNLTK